MTVSAEEVRDGLKAVKRIIEQLERKLGSAGQDAIDPYARRRDLLQQIYWSRNSMERERLSPLLEDRGTSYTWIGQQVKKGYLLVYPLPGGTTRYSVTEKAVRELGLGDDSGNDDITALSQNSFAEDWDSVEDAAYDAL